jgi:TatD DNase family protein
MIDTHAHLTDDRFADDVEAVVDRARAAGVAAIVTIGTRVETSRAALALAERFPDVWASAGIHPHSAAGADEAALEEIRRLLGEPRVVAVGEVGLDYHYDHSPRDVQRTAFLRQIDLAAELDLPVLVHCRDADDDVAAILRERGGEVRGVLHSFAGGPALLRSGLEAGWNVSFSGMITFKNYHAADLVREVPRERLMVETDSPYLAPVPHRGKRNEPAFVPLVAARAAELRGEDAAELAAALEANSRAFYRLPA